MKVKVSSMKIIASQISLLPGVLAHVTFDALTQTLTHPSFPQSASRMQIWIKIEQILF